MAFCIFIIAREKGASLTLLESRHGFARRDTEGYQADVAFCGAPRATGVDID